MKHKSYRRIKRNVRKKYEKSPKNCSGFWWTSPDKKPGFSYERIVQQYPGKYHYSSFTLQGSAVRNCHFPPRISLKSKACNVQLQAFFHVRGKCKNRGWRGPAPGFRANRNRPLRSLDGENRAQMLLLSTDGVGSFVNGALSMNSLASATNSRLILRDYWSNYSYTQSNYICC